MEANFKVKKNFEKETEELINLTKIFDIAENYEGIYIFVY
jgi:hypothetical protein